MPKGMPALKPRSVLERIKDNLVPPGATVFPGSETPEFPEGIPLPDGVRVRTDRGVELRFFFEDQRVSETVRGKPTVSFVLEMGRKRDRIQLMTDLDKFGPKEYEEEFPKSARFKVAIEEPKVITVGQALDDWLVSRLGTIGENSKRDYELLIRNQLKPFKCPEGLFGDSEFIPYPKEQGAADAQLALSRYAGGPVRTVDPNDHQVLGQLPLQLLSDVCINAIRTTMRKEGLSIKRINNLMCPLRGAITRQVLLKKLPINPFDLLQPLKDDKSPLVQTSDSGKDESLDAPLPGDDVAAFVNSEGAPDPFSTEEIAAILSQLDGPMANQMSFSLWSGLRTGETIALRASDLQLDKNRILVRRSLSRGILKTTKTDKQRWVHLLPPARQAIEAQLALFKAPDGWVFPNPFTRQRWKNESKITKRWAKALERANVRYRRPYQTRHTYASMMLSAGENVMYVAGQMGHADWSMLVKVYGQWLPSGCGQVAGSLVSAAQNANWSRLLSVLQSRPFDVLDDSDDDEDEQEAEDETEFMLA